MRRCSYLRRLATSPVHQLLKECGQFGRKSGRCFFEFGADGKAVVPSPDTPSSTPPAARVVLAEEDEALGELLRSFGFDVTGFDDGELPILCAPLGEDCSTYAARLQLDHRRLFAIDIAGRLDKRLTLMRDRKSTRLNSS